MKILFSFKNRIISVDITKEELFNDINMIDDFWGEFQLDGKKYQIQLYHESKSVAIFNVRGTTPISVERFIIGNREEKDNITVKVVLVIIN